MSDSLTYDQLQEILNRPAPLTAADKAELILKGEHCQRCFDPFVNYGVYKRSQADASLCEYCTQCVRLAWMTTENEHDEHA